MRVSSSTGCSGAKDTPIFSASRNKKGKISDHPQNEQADNEKEQKETYHQQELKLGSNAW
jgi:hypothetical protein